MPRQLGLPVGPVVSTAHLCTLGASLGGGPNVWGIRTLAEMTSVMMAPPHSAPTSRRASCCRTCGPAQQQQ
jgi:hypothetical protein